MSMKPDEFRQKLKGIVHLVLTPFTADGDLDEAALRGSLRYVTQNEALKGEDVVFLALGTTGEFYAMDEAENRRSIDIITEEVCGRFPVMIGTAREATRRTIEVSKYAQSAGADAVMIVHPYYVMPTYDNLIGHYESVAEALDIGICIYNNPTTSKLWLPLPALQRLSKVDNIVGLKENTANPMTFLSIMQGLDPKDISMYAGLGHFMYQFVCYYGCEGFVTELLSYAPHLALDLLHAGRAKDIAKVRETTDKIMLFWNWLFGVAASHSSIPSVYPGSMIPSDMPYYQAANKAAGRLVGNECGYSRQPMSLLTDAEENQLREVLVKMGCKVK